MSRGGEGPGSLPAPHGSSTIICLAVAAAAAAALLAPLAASGNATQRLYVGMNLHLTGPNTSEGAVAAPGAVADSGTADVRDLTITPTGSADTARLSGTETYAGQQGAIVTRFDGEAFPLSSPHEVGIGRFVIISATGAYSGVNGSGTFEIVVDATTNQLIGTEVATVHPRATLRSATTSVARAVDRCTIAVPPARATIAVEIANASDFCELFSHMLADNVFHAPVLVTPGVLWHYHDAAFSCRAHYRSTRERMTIHNAPAACRWLQRRATGWRLEGASGYAHAA